MLTPRGVQWGVHRPWHSGLEPGGAPLVACMLLGCAACAQHLVCYCLAGVSSMGTAMHAVGGTWAHLPPQARIISFSLPQGKGLVYASLFAVLCLSHSELQQLPERQGLPVLVIVRYNPTTAASMVGSITGSAADRL